MSRVDIESVGTDERSAAMGILDDAKDKLGDAAGWLKDKAEEIGEQVQEAGETLGEKAQEAGQAIGEKAQEAGQAIGEKAQEAGQAIGDKAASAKHWAEAKMEGSPDASLEREGGGGEFTTDWSDATTDSGADSGEADQA